MSIRITNVDTAELLELLNSCYQHQYERTVSIDKHDKMLLYGIDGDSFYTATPFNIWDTIDPVKGIKDDLISRDVDYALSANQGFILKELHDKFYKEYGEYVIATNKTLDNHKVELDKHKDRLDGIDTTLLTKTTRKFYKSIAERDNDIINVPNGTIAITNNNLISTKPVNGKHCNVLAFDTTRVPDLINYKGSGIYADDDNPIYDEYPRYFMAQGDSLLHRGYMICYVLIVDESSEVRKLDKLLLCRYINNKKVINDIPIYATCSIHKDIQLVSDDGMSKSVRIDIEKDTWCNTNIIDNDKSHYIQINLNPDINITDIDLLFAEGIEVPIGTDISILNGNKYIKDDHVKLLEEHIVKANIKFSDIDNALTEQVELNNTFIPKSQKRQPNGVACLDEFGKVHTDELPDYILGQVMYSGNLTNATGTATVSSAFKSKYKHTTDTLLLTTANATSYEGSYFIATIAGMIGDINYMIGDWIISNGVKWSTIGSSDAVRTVNGKTGDVVITNEDLKALGNANNTIITEGNTYFSIINTNYSTRPTLLLGSTELKLETSMYGISIQNSFDGLKYKHNGQTDTVFHSGYLPTASELYAISSQRDRIITKIDNAYSSYSINFINDKSKIEGHLTINTANTNSILGAYNTTTGKYQNLALYGSIYGINGLVYSWDSIDYTVWHSGNLNPNKINGILTIIPNDSYFKSYNEGIRISTADNNQSSINLGCDPSATDERIEGQWTLVRGESGEFTISRSMQIEHPTLAPDVVITSIGNMHLQNDCYATKFVTTSDINLKKDFKQFDDFDINDINLTWYNMKFDNSKHFGVIAQNIKKYLPDFIYGIEWTEEKPHNHLSVCNTDIQYLMIAKLRKDINDIKSKLLM